MPRFWRGVVLSMSSALMPFCRHDSGISLFALGSAWPKVIPGLARGCSGDRPSRGRYEYFPVGYLGPASLSRPAPLAGPVLAILGQPVRSSAPHPWVLGPPLRPVPGASRYAVAITIALH